MSSQPHRSLSQRYFLSKNSPDASGYDSYWIRYRLQRITRKRVKALQTWMIVACSIASMGYVWFFFVSGLSAQTFSLGLLLVLAWLMLSRFGPLYWRKYLYPTHVEMTQDGIRYHWMRLFLRASSPLVPWDRISHVTTNQVDAPGGSETILEFNVMARGFSAMARVCFLLLAPSLSWGWMTSDRARLFLNMSGIASSDDHSRLQLAIKKYLPSYRIEPKVADDLNFHMHFDSYTDLWFEGLRNSEGRSRVNSLESGDFLNEKTYKISSALAAGGQATVYEAVMLRLPASMTGGDEKRNETFVNYSDLVAKGSTVDELVVSAPADNGGFKALSVVLKEFVLPTEAGRNVKVRVLKNIQREVQLWRKLNHPNIARLLDFFVEDQRAYLVLEKVEGHTLKELVTESGALDQQTVIRLAVQMCDILSYLHRRRPPVIHRDFTPDNLILDKSGDVRLIDFNVAQQLEAQTTKTVVGKQCYIPPEQFRGKSVTQSDIYSLGATLFFLLTGEEPVPISEAHPVSIDSDILPELDRIIAKSTCIYLAGRYQDCQEIRGDLVTLMGVQNIT